MKTAEGITKQQIKKIHTLTHALGMGDDEYRLLLSDYWAETSKKLTAAEADELIRKLEENAVAAGVWSQYSKRGKMRYEHLKDRKGMASPAQLRKIDAMWRDVSYAFDHAGLERSKRKFLFRIAGITEMEDVESIHAQKIIQALQKMQEKRRIHGT